MALKSDRMILYFIYIYFAASMKLPCVALVLQTLCQINIPFIYANQPNMCTEFCRCCVL